MIKTIVGLRSTPGVWKWIKEEFKKEEGFIFWSSLSFYFFLYFFNFSNKSLFLFFALFTVGLIVKFKSLEQGLFWSFVASLLFLVGKRYSFNLIPPEALYNPRAPEGYNVVFTFKVSTVLCLFMLPFLVKSFFSRLQKSSEKIRVSPESFSLALLVLFTILSVTNSTGTSISGLFLVDFFQPVLAFLFSKHIINWKKKKNLLIFMLLSQVVFISFLSLRQLSRGNALGNSLEIAGELSRFGVVGSGLDEQSGRFRPLGTFYHSNYLAAYFLSVPLLVMLFFWQGGEKTKEKLFYLIGPFFLSILLLVITLSRAAWLSLFLGTICLVWFMEKKYQLRIPKFYLKRLLILLILFLVLFAVFVVPRFLYSINSFGGSGGAVFRERLSKEAWELVAKNPFWGVGLKRSVPEMLKNNPLGVVRGAPFQVHNWFLLFLVENGLFSLLSLLFLINFCLKKAIAIIVEKKKNLFKVVVFSSVLAIIFFGFFHNFIGREELLFIFLGVLTNEKT